MESLICLNLYLVLILLFNLDLRNHFSIIPDSKILVILVLYVAIQVLKVPIVNKTTVKYLNVSEHFSSICIDYFKISIPSHFYVNNFKRSHFYPFYIENFKSLDFNSLYADNFKRLHIRLLYVKNSKCPHFISMYIDICKRLYSNSFYATKNKPLLLIMLLLLMCGDTGALINPGPETEYRQTHSKTHNTHKTHTNTQNNDCNINEKNARDLYKKFENLLKNEICTERE